MIQASQFTYDGSSWNYHSGLRTLRSPNLILIFGSVSRLQMPGVIAYWKDKYPEAMLAGCSTAGEIAGESVLEESIVATLIHFEKTRIRQAVLDMDSEEDGFRCGEYLVNTLLEPDLKHIVIFSEGLKINGSDLLRGIKSVLPDGLAVTGGMAGDGGRFEQTLVIANDGIAKSKRGVALGFYGDVDVAFGSLGGWDNFGSERRITKAKGNVLYEIDGKPALELYKSFLGDFAKDLPSSALLFPLNVRTSLDRDPVTRTILAINEEDNSMIFAGDVPEGSYARMMKANIDRLIDGATDAAKHAVSDMKEHADFSLLISCMGRKMVLKQLIEEEVEGVREVIGKGPVFSGFYSYGEIAPYSSDAKCEMHNQTMTITLFKEK